MAIPKLKKQDVIDALKFIDENGVPEHNTSVKYVLVSEDGKKYPPKYVVAVADHLANSTDISTESFNSVDAKNYLKSLGFSIETKQQEKFELSITAESVESTDERFTMDNLSLGDNYKPLDAYFKRANGDVIKRAYSKGERRNSNQTLPRIACQVFEKQLAALSVEDKENFPVCKYNPGSDVIRGIYASVDDFKNRRNTIEYLTYGYDNGRQFVIYCWNIFSTIIFVQECLKRFGEPGDQFILTYREKDEKETAAAETEAAVQEELVQQFKGYHCFIGRVFYMTKELQEIEDSDSMTLNFVTYSDNELSVIDLDNAEIEDLTSINAQRKTERETVTQQFVLPQEVFFKNRTVSKENQEKLLHLLMTDSEFSKYSPLLTHTVDVEGFLHYRWINKILNTFYNASLIDEITCKKFSAIANNYYEGGFKALLGYEVGKYRRGHYKSMDRAYSEAFKSLKDVLEHKIPKILSLFESIVVFVAKQEGIGVETFSLSRVRRYYETGVKSLLGEALIEYGFPTDAIRRIEENHKKIKSMTVSEAKEYCRLHFREVQLLLDTYERGLFIKAMRTF